MIVVMVIAVVVNAVQTKHNVIISTNISKNSSNNKHNSNLIKCSRPMCKQLKEIQSSMSAL